MANLIKTIDTQGKNKALSPLKKIVIKPFYKKDEPVITEEIEDNKCNKLDEEIKKKEQELKVLEEKIKKLKEEQQKQADNIIKEAQQKAEQIIKEAEEKANQSIEETLNNAYNEGFQQGINNSLEIASQTVEHYKNFINELEKTKKELFHKAEKQLLHLAIAIAEKIVNCHISLNKEHILLVINEMIEHLNAKENIKLIINKKSLKVIQDFKKFIVADDQPLTDEQEGINQYYKDMMSEFQEEVIEKIKMIDKFKIVEDNTILEGGCILETNIESIDSTIESKLKEIKDKIMQAFLEFKIADDINDAMDNESNSDNKKDSNNELSPI